jgi:uncharacterized protein YcbK (DUF882 family)
MPKLAMASSAEPKILLMNNLHTGEKLETCYYDGRTFVDSELKRVDHLCRDFRRNEVHPMDKRLLTQLSAIQKLLGTEAEVQVISGYRSPATNEMLRGQSSGGVAKKSLHMQGKAMDFRIPGVSISDVNKAAQSIKAGGVGYYPNSNFVHIDTGSVRFWGG